MSEHQEGYPIVTMCRVLGVSPSGYSTWRQRPPSARAEEDAQLKSRIERIHSWSRDTYGAPRIRAELADEGQRVSRKRVARLMKEVGVEGVSRRRRTRTTHRKPGGSCRAPDLVDRNFTAHRPDQLWVADITYIGTWTGLLVSGRSGGCLQPPRGGLGDGHPLEGRVDNRCPEHGDLATPAGRGHSPFGPGIAVHVHRIRQALPEGWSEPIHGLPGRLLRVEKLKRETVH